MQARKFFITLVINIFLMYLLTILYEYINLADRFSSLQQTFNVVVETSVDSAIGAEELFSSTERKNTSEFSYGESKGETVNNSLVVISNTGKAYNINIYAYAYYFNNYILGHNVGLGGRLSSINPSDAVLTKLSDSPVNTAFAYSYIYGKVGSVWVSNIASNNLSWTKTSDTVIDNYKRELTTTSGKIKGIYKIDSNGIYSATSTATEDRTPTQEFKNFYDAVGKYVVSTINVREKDVSNNSFKLSSCTVPVLMNMGLELDDNFTSYDSTKTMQNYLSSVKIGKKSSSINSVTYSYYYLTPYSLGVTYIPTKVLYPTLLNNLNTTVALNKLSGGNSDKSNGKINQHIGCVSDSTYTHKTSSLEDGYIINDGNIEYDLSTLNVSVDYVAFDFKDWKTDESLQEIVRRIEGSISTVNHTSGSVTSKGLSEQQKKYKSAEAILGTSYGTISSQSSVRIIARITAQVKIHVPYQCNLLKFNCDKFTGGTNSEHYDIKDYDASTGKYKSDSTGIWYEYTTYRCHAQ